MRRPAVCWWKISVGNTRAWTDDATFEEYCDCRWRYRWLDGGGHACLPPLRRAMPYPCGGVDRKSTRLNSSHVAISYAVFCLKKKKQTSRSYILTCAIQKYMTAQ